MTAALKLMQTYELEQILALVKQRAALVFRASSHDHVEMNCRARVKDVAGGNVSEYCRLLEKTPVGTGEWNTLIDVLTVHETTFFRHQPSYDYVRNNVFGKAMAGTTVRAWCVGCATGEEVYSLAMTADAARDSAGGAWNYMITGTDVSASCIEASRNAVYQMPKYSRIPAEMAALHARQIDDRMFCIGDELKRNARFMQHNCLNGFDVLAGGLDLIWCQNMVIYYETEQRNAILDGMIRKLRVGGMLVLGPGEGIGWRNPNAAHVLDYHIVHAFRRTS